MKHKFSIIAIVFTIIIGFGFTDRAEARPEVTLDVFYDALSPYGEWIEHEYYGYIWQPVGVDEYWKPYRDGNWQYSDEGWIWVSDEPWGWATYHYGRWVPDDYYGWIWIPGVDWAPAYVEWYDSPGYIGWSPRPPDNNFFLEIGLSFGGYGYYQPSYYASFNYYKPYYGYKPYHKHYRTKHHYRKHHYAHADHSVYVPYKHFSHTNAKFVAVEGPHKTVVHRNTKNISNVTVINNRTVHRGPDRHTVEHRSGKRIKQVNVVDRDLVQVRGKREVNQLRGSQYNIYRPKVVKRGHDKPETISKRYDGHASYKAGNSRNLEKKGVTRESKGTVVNRSGRNTGNDYNPRDGYRNSVSQKYSNKGQAYKGNSQLTPPKSNRQQINRNKISTQYQSSKHSQFDKNKGNKSQVNRSSSQNQYKSKQDGNKLRGKSAKNALSPRNHNAKSVKNTRKPYKASNKRLSPPNSQKNKAAYKSQKPQVKARSVNNRQRHQKSFKSNKANNYAKPRKVNNVHKGSSNKKASKKSTVRSAPTRSMTRSTVNKSFKSSRSSMRSPGSKSFNRQARR